MYGSMPTTLNTRTKDPNVHSADSRGVRIIAKSVYRELRNSGHSRSDIVAFTNAVLELVTAELRDVQKRVNYLEAKGGLFELGGDTKCAMKRATRLVVVAENENLWCVCAM